MNNIIFPNERIAALYSYYHVEKAEDKTFMELFHSLADWLEVVDQKRNFIDTYVIRSDKAQILVIPNEDKTRFSLIWDVSFWEFYEQFVRAFFSIMNIASDENLPEANKRCFFVSTEKYFLNSIIDYLKKRFSAYKDICSLLEGYRFESKDILLYINDDLLDASIEVCTLGKEFILMHELEHILYFFSPEIYQQDSIVFDEALKWFHDEMLPFFNSEIIRTESEVLKMSVEHIQNTKDGKRYIELFNDYHAFFEMMMYHHENICNTSVPFTRNSQSYFYGVKLLKMFESCINYLTRVVENAASTKFQAVERRFAQVKKASEEYQRIIFSRDYLAVEIIWVGLFWYAEKFPIDRTEYLESLDTENFAQPYTKVLEPIINSFANELIKEIICKEQ